MVYDNVEKADASKGHQNPKRELGVTMHFSEMILEFLIIINGVFVVCMLSE